MKKKTPYFFQAQPAKSSRQIRREQERKKRLEAKHEAKRATKQKASEFKDALEKMYKRDDIKIADKSQSDKLTELNNTLGYIKGNKDINKNQTLSSYLRIIMKKEMGLNPSDQLNLFPGFSNDYFEIDKAWDGNPSSLISHTTFKKLKDNVNVDAAINKIINSAWGDENRHKLALRTGNDEAYNKNISNLNLSGEKLGLLRDIMNSSEVWHIVADKYGLNTKEYDSKQAKKEWDKMTENMNDLLNLKRISQQDIDKVKRALMNGSTEDGSPDLNKLIESVLKKYL